jgi:hypothetical protein
MDANPVEGILRALTIVCYQTMPSSSLFQNEPTVKDTGTAYSVVKVVVFRASFVCLVSLYTFQSSHYYLISACNERLSCSDFKNALMIVNLKIAASTTVTIHAMHAHCLHSIAVIAPAVFIIIFKLPLFFILGFF